MLSSFLLMAGAAVCPWGRSYETDVRISSKLKILTSATLVYTNANYTFIAVIFSCSPIQNAMTVGGCEDILLYGMTSKGPHH